MSLTDINTPCTRCEWARRADIWVKDEGSCPTGTFKDRLAWRLTSLLSEPDQHGLLVSSITFGNTLVSLATAFASAFTASQRPKLLGVFPRDFSRRTIGPDNRGRRMLGRTLLGRLREQGAVCIEHDLSAGWLAQDDIAALARGAQIAFVNHQDVSNGIEVPSYEAIVAEGLEQCETQIDCIIVPVGAGVLFEETVRYVERHFPRIRVIGVTTLDQYSVADKIHAAYSQYMRDLVVYGVACYPGLPRHPVFAIDDDSIMSALGRIPTPIQAEPSAAASFALLDNHKHVPPHAGILVINTGNGIIQETVPCP